MTEFNFTDFELQNIGTADPLTDFIALTQQKIADAGGIPPDLLTASGAETWASAAAWAPYQAKRDAAMRAWLQPALDALQNRILEHVMTVTRYYDRSKGKEVRTVHSKKPRDTRRRRKAKYQSKAYRAYQKYLKAYFCITLSAMMAANLYWKANQDGFIRKFLATTKAEATGVEFKAVVPPRKIEARDWYDAYRKMDLTYKSRTHYQVPVFTRTWFEENGLPNPEIPSIRNAFNPFGTNTGRVSCKADTSSSTPKESV